MSYAPIDALDDEPSQSPSSTRFSSTEDDQDQPDANSPVLSLRQDQDGSTSVVEEETFLNQADNSTFAISGSLHANQHRPEERQLPVITTSSNLVLPPLEPFAQFPRCATFTSRKPPPDPPPSGFAQFADYDGSVRNFRFSTWRNRTAAERRVADALDKIEDRDLGVHLYNVHRLKRKVRDRDERATTPETSRAGKRLKVDEDGVEREEEVEEAMEMVGVKGNRKGWIPPRTWTAWPMSPETVPREWERKKWDDVISNQRKKIPQKRATGGPTANRQVKVLEEVLLTTFLKQAKEKFRQRAWESEHQEVVSPGKVMGHQQRPVVLADDEIGRKSLRPSIASILQKLDKLLTGLHHQRASYAARLALDEGEETPSGRRSRRASRSASRVSTRKSIKYKGKIKASSSPGPQTTVRDQQTKSDKGKEKQSAKGRHPLAISTRTLSKSRAGSSRATSRPPQCSPDEDEDSPSSPSNSFYTNRSFHTQDLPSDASTSSSPSRFRSPSPSSQSLLITPGQYTSRAAPSTSTPRRQSRPPRVRLSPRNWSDVLGVASMSGWDLHTVRRAQGRLMGLLGESIKWQLPDMRTEGESDEQEEESGEDGYESDSHASLVEGEEEEEVTDSAENTGNITATSQSSHQVEGYRQETSDSTSESSASEGSKEGSCESLSQGVSGTT